MAAATFAATNNAATASDADVQTAINLSVDGDTAKIPAGSVTWNTGISTTKKIFVLGSGTNNTHVVCGVDIVGGGTVNFNVSAGGFPGLAGIFFDVNQKNRPITITGGNKAFVLSSCCFTNGLSGTFVIILNNICGVSSHCIFKDYNAGYDVHHASWNGTGLWGDASWNDDSLWGTTNFWVVEDNSFYGRGNVGCVDQYEGARLVLRYSYIEKDEADGHGTDSGQRQRSARVFECYKNGFNFTGGTGQNELRGGTAVFWGNNFTNFSEVTAVKYFRETTSESPWGQATGSNCWDQNSDGTGYKALDQPGVSKGDLLSGGSQNVAPSPCAWPNQTGEPIYVWNNTNNGVGSFGAAIGSGYNNVVLGRDVINNTAKPGYVALAYPHPLISTPDPNITGQPQNSTVCANNTATFTVTASGQSALSYQWNWHATNVSGATASSWTTPTLVSADGVSSVFVAVTDNAGTLNSSTVTLTVNADPAITVQPQNTIVSVGQNATFTVTASSCNSYTLSYQWKFNGGNVGSNSSSYTRNNCQLSDSGGAVTVVVTDTAGNLTSSTATLTVTTSAVNASLTVGQGSGAANAGVVFGVGSGAGVGTLNVGK